MENLLRLVLEINRKTTHAAFFEIAGNINTFSVRVAVGKTGSMQDDEGYKINKSSNYIYSTSYTESLGDKKKVREVSKELEIILNEGLKKRRLN